MTRTRLSPVTLSVIDVDREITRELRDVADEIIESSGGSWRRLLDAVRHRADESVIAASVLRTADDGGLPMLLRGLPVWDSFRTPASRDVAPHAPQAPDLVPLMVMAGLGAPLAFTVTQDGRLVQDVVASAAPGPVPVNGPVGGALELHIEAGFARFKPDHVGLYCVYNDDRVGTILSVLKPGLIPGPVARELSSVRPSAVLQNGTMDELDAASTFVEGADDAEPGKFRVNYDLGYFAYDLTTAQQEALAALTGIVERERRPVVLNPGEMVIWDNHTTIHGRDSYPLHYNGRDRWLKRVYTRREIDSCSDLLVDRSLNTFP